MLLAIEQSSLYLAIFELENCIGYGSKLILKSVH